MRAILTVAGAAAAAVTSAAAQTIPPLSTAQQARLQSLPAAERDQLTQAIALDSTLHPQTGDIRLPAANSTLHLGNAFYYLPPDQAKRVLVQGWHNPAAMAQNTLGLVFPEGSSWTDNKGWGANLTFDQAGYVPAVDHSSADYEKLDKQMRDAEPKVNEARKSDGAPAIHYVGWAQPPTYDDRTHTAIWARDLQFAGTDVDTLNYDIRLLGRRGVLSMNVISSMPELSSVRPAAEQFRQAVSFDPGWRYEDYQRGDKRANYGIAGLIAAGVGLVVAKKFGLLAILMLFGKKLFVVVAALVAAAVARMRRLFSPKKAQG